MGSSGNSARTGLWSCTRTFTPGGGWRGRCFPRSVFRITILVMVSDEQIEQWADEAEAGYDVDEMRRRGRGRPGRGSEPMQVVAVRLTAEELAAVDAIAEREHITRSEAIRRALAGSAA